MAANVTVPGVFVPDPYATINLSYQTQQNANIAIQLLSQIYAAAAAGTLQVKNDGEATTGGAGPLKEFTIGDSGGIQNSGTTEGTVPAGFLGIVDAFTNQVSEIVGAPGQANETVVASGNMHFFTNGGSGTVISGQGNNLVAANPSGDGPWTVLFDGGNNTVYANSGNFNIDDGNASTTGANQIFLGSGDDTVQSWGNDTIVAAPGGTALVATFTPGSVFFGNTGSSVFVNLGGADTFIAGGGHDTAFAVGSGGLYFGNAGPLLFVGGPNAASTVVGGTGGSTLFGASGGSINLFSTTDGALLVAGAGNETLNAAGTTGTATFWAGGGNDSLVGGSSSDIFAFVKGVAHGVDTIGGWTAKDTLALIGYGSGGIVNQSNVGGNALITLSDGTTISFTGVSNIPSSHISQT